jgi:hypothetical protein
MGFTGMSVSSDGTIYLLNNGGLGGNKGDIVRVPPGGEPELYINDSALQQHLPADYVDFPVRLLPNSRTGGIAILVCDVLDQAAAGEASLTEWDAAGAFSGVRASRSQLLTGTGGGLLTCPARAAISDAYGNYHLWATRDNETLLIVPNNVQMQGSSLIVY